MNGEPTDKRQTMHLLFLAVLTLGVYLKALQAGFLAVDDVSTITFIQSGNISLGKLFCATGHDYYRPLTNLSFLADFLLFGGNPAGYHLTNILLHLANAILVYFLATALLGKDRSTGSYSLLAALFFALHPVNSEAVVWISARTDLLCCFFALISMILLLKVSRTMSPLILPGLFLSFLCSLLAKEASLFLPLLAIVYFVLERKTVPLKNALAACGALGIAAIIYLLLRKGLPLAPASAATTTSHAGTNPFTFFIDGAATLGFYLGKLFYPFPLSIAITEIPTKLCLGFFLLCCGAAAFLWKQETTFRFPLALLAASLVPPLGAFFLSLAWTPYAERYLYIPSVAFVLCCAIFFRHYLETVPVFVPAVFIILLAIPTAYRVSLWTQPIPFWQDAVAKSPGFGTLRLPLAAEYLEEDRFAETEDSLRHAYELGLPRKSARNFYQELRLLLIEKKIASRPAATAATPQ
jgi:hypothetical protein